MKKNTVKEKELLQAENERLKAENEKLKEKSIASTNSQLLGKVLILPFPKKLEELRDASIAYDNLMQEIVAEGLTGMNRHQKNAIGDIRLGFVNNVFRYINETTDFNPTGFDNKYYAELVEQLDLTMQTLTHLGSSVRLLRDISIVTGDVLYGMALLWYRNIQVLSDRRIPGAEVIYRELRTHFRNRRPLSSLDHPPTEAQVLRDAKALLRGKKDGEIVIEGHAKHTTPSEKKVLDDTHKPLRKNFQSTISGTICKHCGCENGAGSKFCKDCGGKL